MVGASLAGLQAAETLRLEGFDGRLVVIGDEPHAPYDRPPLSKQLLAGEWEEDRIVLPTVGDDLDIEWLLGAPAMGLDPAIHRLDVDGSEPVDVDAVIVATGARARSLPGAAPRPGLFTLRTLDDCRALRSALVEDASRVVVVGAGFIGAEVAATCRGLGLEVTMVEPLPAPLAGVLGAQVGGVVAELHRDHGVDVRTGSGVASVDGDDRVRGVTLTDGTTVAADVVVVGIGVEPATGWLRSSGLDLDPDGGLRCDATCRAAPGVFGAGDVASWPNPVFDGERMRVEHWDHAFEQGAHAARALLAGGDAEPFAAVPWFWSDQFDRKIQLAGRPRPDDDVEIVDGSLGERQFVALYGRAGRLSAVLGVNRPRHVMLLRPLIAEGISWDDARARF